VASRTWPRTRVLKRRPSSRRFLDHPGIVFNDPVGAAARVQLARAFALSGDTMRAKTAYQDFLTLWKDADQDIPIFQQAKAEFARLQ
jgi:hypothetical protein